MSGLAYNFVKTHGISSSQRKIYNVPDLSGGVCFDGRYAADNQLCGMENMSFSDGMLCMRGGICGIKGDISGKFYSRLEGEFFGNVLFHCGSCVYRFDGNEVHRISEVVSACPSFFIRMKSSAYLYTSDRRVFLITNEFVCAEASPYVPNIAVYTSNDSDTMQTDEAVNLMTRFVKCTYTGISNSAQILPLPFAMDTGYPAKLYVNGMWQKRTIFNTHGDNRVSLSTVDYGIDSSCTLVIEYAVKDSEKTPVEKNIEKFFGSTISFSFGGTSGDGTRAFVTGNDAYPGWYLRSNLTDPLYFPDTCAELLGDGCEKITGAARRYEKQYIFSEKHIYAMTYSFTAENGAQFDICEINTSVGCTVPRTVQAVDNTLVFCDKILGVHILQSTDIFDELNVKHISENITKSESDAFVKTSASCSCNHGRMYWILCDGELFVWDYGRTPYYTSGDQKKAEKRLSWHRFTGFADCADMFSLAGRLYFIFDNDGCSLYSYNTDADGDTVYADGTAETRDICCTFRTKAYDFGIKHARKRAEYVSLDYSGFSDTPVNVEITVYGDGKEICRHEPFISRREGRIKLKIPTFYASEYSVGLKACGGRTGFYNLAFCICEADRKKHTV